LQREDTTVDNAARNIQGLLTLLSSTRELTISDAIDEANFLSCNMDIAAEYKETRKRKLQKRHMKMMVQVSREKRFSKDHFPNFVICELLQS
jgi:hypothetical protein